MPTYLRNHLIHKRYENMEAWVKMPSAQKASRWVFGYWHGTSHWLGVKIDWVEKSVQVYDPWDKPRPKVLDVSGYLAYRENNN